MRKVEINERSLDEFETWLLERGRAQVTADAYRSNVELADADARGITGRLLDKSLSPNTRRLSRASLASWADFTEDLALAKRLKQIKLPPPRRITPKIPMSREEWSRLMKHVATVDDNPACGHVTQLMALRGMRVGDVIRLERKELASARSSGRLIYVGKGEKRQDLAAEPVMTVIEALLKMKGGRWKTVGELVSERGSDKVRTNRVRRYLSRCAKHVAVHGVYPHRLRRSYATYFLAELSGDPAAAVKLQRHLGWSNLATAMAYVDAVDTGELDTVAERMLGRIQSP